MRTHTTRSYTENKKEKIISPDMIQLQFTMYISYIRISFRLFAYNNIREKKIHRSPSYT